MERLIFEEQLEFLPSSQISHSRIGIGFEKLDRAVFDPSKAYDKVARTGIKPIRIQSGWARTEKEKGVYDFAWLDDIVDNLISRGMEPWLDLCYGNALYTDLAKPVFGAVGCPPIMSQAEMDAWLRYVNDILAHGLAEHMDALTFHIYSSYDGERQQTVESLRNLVDAYNPNITLIQGEAGAQTRSDGNGAMKGFAWTKTKQLKYLLRTMISDLWCGVEFASYFSTMDMIEALRGRLADKASYLDYGYFGILSAEFDENGVSTGEYTEKPSYYAISTLATLMKGDTKRYDIPWSREYLPSRRVNGVDCQDNTLKVYGFRLDDGRTALCYWNCVPLLTHTYEGTVSMSVYGQDTSKIRLVDLSNGKIYRLPETMLEDLGNGGVGFRNIPLTDTPIALIFG